MIPHDAHRSTTPNAIPSSGSVWCFYAGLLSVMVYIELASRRTAARPAP